MFGHTFEHGLIRKYVILFGTLFNDVYIKRTDDSNNQTQVLKIPISYAPRDKLLARIDADPELNRQAAVVLPRMSFEMTSLIYDGERKLNTVNKNVYSTMNSGDDGNDMRTVYNPVPYTISFSLYIYVKNAEDGTKILEQILPFFTPEWTATVNLLPDLNLAYDIPTILQSVSSEDIYDGDYQTRRSLVHTLEFIMKGYIFGPVSTSGVIKLANTNFYTDAYGAAAGTSSFVNENVEIRPGLTTSNTATSNASLTIPLADITADDPYGFIKTITSIDDEDSNNT